MEASFPPVPLGELARVAGATARGEPSTLVREVAYDPAHVPPGSLFCCIAGSRADGHMLAPDAVAAGAVALMVERWVDVNVPQLLVGSVRRAMGPVSAVVFGSPAEALRIAGITGTNGKTTTTYLLTAIFGAAGFRTGVIGTTGARMGDVPMPIPRTTPEAPDLHRLLAHMVTAGVDAVAMEVSSHAMSFHRADGLVLDVASFTNLSHDHLDVHQTMEAYFEAKASLFTPAHAKAGVVNVDDPWGRRLCAVASVPVRSFGVDVDADIRAADVDVRTDGVSFTIDGRPFTSPLRGAFNVSNCVGAVAVARGLGVPDDASAAGIASLAVVPGRMEPVDAGQDFTVVVDYAHTPDSILNVLRGARVPAVGRVIVVFGCGGDRDRAKRPDMGRAATSNADLTIVTTDNPRSEDPLSIIREIEAGAAEGGGRYLVEPDRRAAIEIAMHEASTGDVVVIAGKGHEATQEVGAEAIPFDDRVVAREVLETLG